MFRTVLFTILTAVIALAVAGCGGGGGGTSPGGGNQSVAGTWSLNSIYLPNDQFMIGSGGEVFVAGDQPVAQLSSTLGSTAYFTRIGTCSSSGTITFSGSWTRSGILYRISGDGAVNTQAHTVSATVTIQRGSQIVLQNLAVNGSLFSDAPPVVPTFPNDNTSPIDPPPPAPL